MISNGVDPIYGDVPETWHLVSLGSLMDSQEAELLTGPFGTMLHASSYRLTGTPVVAVQHLGENRLKHVDLPRVDDDTAKRLQRYKLKKGDILFGRKGSVERRAIIQEQEEGWLEGSDCIRLRFLGKSISPNFISYVLGSAPFKDWIMRHAGGATMPSLNQTILRLLPLPLPPLSEQQAIARILGALDDKIELNRRMNHTLESMAQALFRQSFVENEDVEEWKVVPLPEIIEVNPSRSLKKGDVAPYLDMANMPTQGHRGIEWVDRPFGSGTKFINGDTLLARITPCLENGKTAFVDFLKDGQVGWGSTEYIIFRPKPPLPPEYGYYLARSEELRNHAIQNMMGTSGRQRTPASCFDTYTIVTPPVELANRFGDFAKMVINKVTANDNESRTLAAIRNALLPKLLSGELRVKQAEKVIQNT